MNKRQLWTCVLPEELVLKYGLSFATYNFSMNLISGVRFDKVFSTMPLYVGGKMEASAFQDDRFDLIYDELRKRRGVWQRIAAIKEQFQMFKLIPEGTNFWFYNINTLNAVLFILLKLFKPSVTLNVIVLDFTPFSKLLELNRFYLKLINSAHGRISLANSPLFNQSNLIVIPGVVPENVPTFPDIKVPSMEFLLSGALNETISQTTIVLKAFSQLPGCQLHITGKGDSVPLIEEYAEKYPNIIYHEQLSYSDYIRLLHNVTFQLSTRNSSEPENHCNFPSKIIEALLHNRIVLTTISYPQLDGIKVLECDATDEVSLKAYIENLDSWGAHELLQYANQGNMVKRKFSTNVWKFAMDEIEREH